MSEDAEGLRRDLREWRDALVKARDELGDHACIRPGDVVAGVERILDLDRARNPQAVIPS